MKGLILILIALYCSSNIFAQDGGNICYVKTAQVAKSDEGKFVHLDFGEESFAPFGRDRSIEEVALQIKGQTVEFREYRVDDGFNNWWDQQYLESASKVDGKTLRITKFLLQKVFEKEFKLKAFFQYFDAENRPTHGPWMTEVLSIEKNRLVEVLFKIGSNEPCPPRAADDN